jgi:tetratricopeptide (TPR) repeat protein
MLTPWRGVSYAVETSGEEKICDPVADYFLGMEDYPEAIGRHIAVINQHPQNALAHYHLGFAYGMTGHHPDELSEYGRAIDLGLSDWELFLNLGLLYMEAGRLKAATDVLRLATLVGQVRPETHFNLGLAYERMGSLAQAEQEILLSLRLDSDQLDARNTLAVIYAERGNYGRAREEWVDLINERPGYAPARTNLAILTELESSRSKTRDGAGFVRSH